MIPVMLWGILILAKRYGIKDFGMATLVTIGCTLFLMTGEVKSKVSTVGRGLHSERDAGFGHLSVVALQGNSPSLGNPSHTRARESLVGA